MENIYYVYMHKRATDGSVFYIGKGKGNRAFQERNRSAYWKNVAEKNGYTVELIESGLSEEEAFDLEIIKIAEIGLERLVNMTAGGQGCSGRPFAEKSLEYIRSQENRDRVSAQWKGVKRGREFSIKLSIINKGREVSMKQIENQRAAKKDYMKKVYCITNCMTFESVHYAAEWLKESGIDKKSVLTQIRHCCKGRAKTAAGMQWRYIE